jgi:hypothetical protein
VRSKSGYVEVNLPQMRELADLYSLDCELGIARDLCEKAVEICTDKHHDALVVDGLTTAALIRYIRCFHATGKRIALKLDDLSGLSEKEKAWHGYFKSMRDKHVAHSVNGYEQAYVKALVVYDDRGTRLPFTSLYPGVERAIFNGGNAVALLQLIQAALQIVLSRRHSAEEAALKFVNEIPEEVVRSFEPHQPLKVDPKDVARVRKDT